MPLRLVNLPLIRTTKDHADALSGAHRQYNPALSTVQDATRMADAHCGRSGWPSALASQGRSGALGGLIMLTFCR